MGGVTKTVQNLEIVSVDTENNLLLIKGSIPGPKKGLVIVKSAIKANGIVNPAKELVVNQQPENNEVAAEVTAETAE